MKATVNYGDIQCVAYISGTEFNLLGVNMSYHCNLCVPKIIQLDSREGKHQDSKEYNNCNCQVRKHDFEKKINWTIKNISKDSKHTIVG